jgi:hypothetical protein
MFDVRYLGTSKMAKHKKQRERRGGETEENEIGEGLFYFIKSTHKDRTLPSAGVLVWFLPPDGLDVWFLPPDGLEGGEDLDEDEEQGEGEVLGEVHLC